LGDEGSGAVIGRKLLSNVLKKQLPKHITDAFFETYKTNTAEILENIYKKPFPNRYAANFTKFISEHKSDPSMQSLLLTSFEEFIIRNVLQYSKINELPVHFTGSIAYFFSDVLKKALCKYNLIEGKIIKAPIEGLIDYHLRNI
jgi:N-acetylglucosamine kinase-like BadF-type ATPase